MENQQSATPAPVVELIENGATVMRIENENLQAMAIQRPRDVKGLSMNVLEELRTFPQFASKAYYSIPYKDRSSGTEVVVLVEGPSIKAANMLARHWGNNSSGFRVVGSDDERVSVQGVFIDHETGMRRTAEISVSRKARKRDGTYYQLPADRLNMAIQAGGSKAVRNAILNALPIGLVECYFEEAKKLAARGGRTIAQDSPDQDTANISAQIEESLKELESLGVERAEVAAHVSRQPKLETEEAVSAYLVGVLSAIKDGQASIEEVFSAPADTPIQEPKRKNEPVKKEEKKRTLPADRRRMQSKLDGSTCNQCKKPIRKGEWIYKHSTGFWVHEETC